MVSGTTNDLWSVCFTSAGTGYAVGDAGTILKTTDAGTTWTAQLSGTVNGIEAVYFPHADTGYAVGDTGIILKTIDGGVSWISQESGTMNNLYSLSFTDVSTGYTAGSSGTSLNTTNGGYGTFISEAGSTGSDFTLSPNPASSRIHITTSRTLPGEISIGIFNIEGQERMNNQFHNQNVMEMDVHGLAEGIYLVKIQTGTGTEIKKLVIQ